MKAKILTLLCMISLLLVGCNGTNDEKKENTVMRITDVTGEKVGVSEMPKKVIVLSSSWVDIWQLAGGEVAGTTSDALTENTLGKDVIDVGTIKDPNVEIILSSEPDFVILSQDITSHGEIAKTLKEAGIPCYVTKVESFDEYLKVLKDFCTITGNEENYETYGTKIESDVNALLAKLPTINDGGETTALFLRAFSSGVKAKADEHVVCDILDRIGVKNIAKTEGFPLEDLSLEVILKQDPDYIFIVTMGDEEEAKTALETSLSSDPAWGTLSAVKNDRVIFLSKDLYHYKPNARWAEAYETILKIVYPEIYK